MPNVAVYHDQGGAIFSVATGGTVRIRGGSIVPTTGTKASNIAAVTSNAAFNTAPAAAVNSIITALKGVGILATS